MESASLFVRIAIGKSVGFILGLIGFVLMPYWLGPEIDAHLRWGVLLWYTTLGAIIAAFSPFHYHPFLKITLPWWVLAPLVGAWMNFLLALMAFDSLKKIMVQLSGEQGFFQSPYWISTEGAIAGIIIGFFIHRFTQPN